MDKNKNRSDLLAAGRKQLEKFRQKKDNKGSRSKSLGKSANSGHDVSVDAASEAEVTPQSVVDREKSTSEGQDNIALSEINASVDSAASDPVAATNELPDTAVILETPQIVEIQSDCPEANDTRLNQSANGFGTDHEIEQQGGSSLVTVDAKDYVPSTSNTVVVRENSLDSDTHLLVGPLSHPEKLHMEKQEVACPGSNQIDESKVVESERDGDISPLEFTKSPKKEIHAPTQFFELNNTALSVVDHDAEVAHKSYNNSDDTYPFTDSGVVSVVKSETSGLLGEGLLSEEKKQMLDVSSGYHTGQATQTNPQIVEGWSPDRRSDGSERYIGSGVVDLSSMLDGSSIKLSQLAEILKILDEDKFKFLFMSREMSPGKLIDPSPSAADEYIVHDAFEKLKEELYVASFSRDAFHLQLSEHKKLVDEMSVMNASVIKIQGNNEVLAEEIQQCRYELLKAVSDREELLKNLEFCKAEVEAVSTKANGLQNELEIARGGMSSLLSELDDCRNLVAALQAEKDEYEKRFDMMTEQNNKLLEENRSVLLENSNMMGVVAEHKTSLESLQKENVKLSENLTFLSDEKLRLEEEKDYISCEKNNMLADLVMCRSTVEALEAANMNSNEIFTSVSEDRKKLEEEKELSLLKTVRLTEELADCKDLVSTLQNEISNFHDVLTSVKEEKIKYEEELKSMFHEYEKQWHNMTEIEVLEAFHQSECSKAIADLQKTLVWIDQLSEENEILKKQLEFPECNIKKFDNKHLSQFEETGNHGIASKNFTSEKPKSECHAAESSSEQLKSDIFDDLYGFVALKTHLDDFGAIIQKIEETIEGLRLHEASMRPSDKVVSPVVSRLIQAFESKGHELEQASSSENQMNEGPYVMINALTQNLGALLKELVRDADNAAKFCFGLKQSELLHVKTIETYLVDEPSIELMVVYEVMREHARHVTAQQGDLLSLCDSMQNQGLILKLENSRISAKLNEFQAKTDELQMKLEKINRDSDEIVDSIFKQVKNFETEFTDRETNLKEEWNSAVSKVLYAVDELDSTVKNFPSTSLPGINGEPDVVSRVSGSVFAATKIIGELREQVEASKRDHEVESHAFNDMHEKWGVSLSRNEMATKTLSNLYNNLRQILGNHNKYDVNDNKELDFFDPDIFNTFLEELKLFLGERSQLEYAKEQLEVELRNSAKELNELEKKCFNSNDIRKLVEDIKQCMEPEGIEICADEPISLLKSLINLLVQHYKEAKLGLKNKTSLEVKLLDSQRQMENLNTTLVQYENENLVCKQSMKDAENHVVTLDFELQQKVTELEQSEQRVSSLREKLGIAVTKGKGLISQRDNLKQSLAETSKELEKCSLELLSKDAMLHDLETKLKVYSEAGERMEALESELSYIRNSATALRESFLLKDSVLQRIEEILEDLELPEHFHSGDIIEKIDWLGKLVSGNALHLGDWDQRSSIGGGSYSDAAFVGADGLKEDMQLNPSPSDDFRRKYEELQSKFYGLAEQNEMLEQSLMERKQLMQRWEEILDRVDMPSQMRSTEPEDKIQWLKQALADAQSRSSSLQEKVDNLEHLCGSITADLQDSHGRISEVDAAFQQACQERDILSRDFELLSRENAEISEKASNFKTINASLQNEISMLHEQMLQIEKDTHHTDTVMRRLQDLVKVSLQGSNVDDDACAEEGIKSFEEQLRKLVDKYTTFSSGALANTEIVDVHAIEKGEFSHSSRNTDEQEIENLGKKLEDVLGELTRLKDEKDRCMQNSQSLLHEAEVLKLKNEELKEFLNQEEQKSASLREKLNVAVRKGKSLVQQRDGMKQLIEERNSEIEHFKSEIRHAENAMFESEKRNKELSIVQDRVQVMEFENTSLRDRLTEIECCLQEKDITLTNVLDALNGVDIGIAFNNGNLVEKLREMGSRFHDMSATLCSAEQEARKSKRASELLLAELNEVQERNDVLQEEIAKASDELSVEKNSAKTFKIETHAHIENLSSLLEERDRKLSDIMTLNSGIDQLREELFEFKSGLDNVLSKDREVLKNMSNIMNSFLESGDSPDFSSLSPEGTSKSDLIKKLENEVFFTELDSLNQLLYKHSNLLHEEVFHLSEVMKSIHREFSSHKKVSESMKRDAKQLESIGKERESELRILKENVSLLYEACVGAIFQLENWNKLADENALVSRDSDKNFKSQVHMEREHYNVTDGVSTFATEGIKSVHDKLLSTVKDYVSMQNEFNAAGRNEMKSTIMSLQKELQEKDIQRERICRELVDQIKEAESNSKKYHQDLQLAEVQIRDLQEQADVRKGDFEVLKQRIEELQDQEANSTNLEQKVNTLADALAAKEQETEALMQALDEEETQMEDLVNKIGGLETELKLKNQDLENLEATRKKILKKLSTTVSKFDELHYLSENLLSEVEKLQSQLQERDGEISFLRQEVTRCTHDALTVTQMSKKSSDEVHGILAWLDTLLSGVKVNDGTSDDMKDCQVDECKEVLRKQILALVSELESLRAVVKDNDVLLQQERSKVEELTKKHWHLQNFLRNKESEIIMLQGAGDSAKANNNMAEIVEVEPITNKRIPSGIITPQVRSLRKSNTDQIAISVDVDHNDDRLGEDDDDKAHGFKSLTTSKIVPRFTRPVSDMIDGLWVSCDRALMRRPVMRLSIIIYWAVLHALLATFIV